MIIFFTATGNSYDAARIIAEATGDEMVSLGRQYKQGDFELHVKQGEDFGIVFPVYRWSTPRIVDEFFRKVKFATDDGEPFRPGYAYAVEIYGYFPGEEMTYLENLIGQTCGITIDATFQIPSVATCIYVSNPPNIDKQAEQIAKEEFTAETVAKRIKAKEYVREAKGTPLGRLLSKATGTDEKPRPIKQFNVNLEKCTSCGTCAKVCPTNTIRMESGHPVWQGDDCTECLACVHRCPAEAIEYGKISKGRRRFTNPILKELG